MARFHFITLSQPDDDNAKRAVRRHAARNDAARRKRVSAYQATKGPSTSPPSTPSSSLALTRTPSPLSVLSSNTSAFTTTARPVTPSEIFLLTHFATTLTMTNALCITFTSPAQEVAFRSGMASHFMELAMESVGMLAGVLLAAARDMSSRYGDLGMCPQATAYFTRALWYKAECMREVGRAVKEGRVDDVVITTTLWLASDASMSGDGDSAKKHLRAALEMIRLRGSETFLTDGWPGSKLLWLVKNSVPVGPSGSGLDIQPTCVRAAVLREADMAMNQSLLT